MEQHPASSSPLAFSTPALRVQERFLLYTNKQTDSLAQDTLTQPEVKPVDKKLTAEQIQITKDLLYDQYTLDDIYPYKDTTRQFQWDKIKERLALLENIQLQPSTWAILQNYKNRNGEAPLVRSFKRNAYGRVADTLGIERYQSVPLYLLTDTLVPERYAGWRTNPFYRRWGKIQ